MSNNELANQEPRHSLDTLSSEIEKVLVQGDLAPLTANQRVEYVNAVCHKLGLNPMTQPFDYIKLNGKIQLYAKRTCTDQLRKLYRISITSAEGKLQDDLYIVNATAQTPEGRVDRDTGVVTLGGLKGEAAANAMMKALTKAKRRVTLSICGLGFLDESEVEDAKRAESQGHGSTTMGRINLPEQDETESDQDVVDGEVVEDEPKPPKEPKYVQTFREKLLDEGVQDDEASEALTALLDDEPMDWTERGEKVIRYLMTKPEKWEKFTKKVLELREEND